LGLGVRSSDLATVSVHRQHWDNSKVIGVDDGPGWSSPEETEREITLP
jgi:hypothetical protein